jgi:hypothetical protein
MKIPGLLGMRQKKGRESLDNIDKRGRDLRQPPPQSHSIAAVSSGRRRKLM